MWKPIKKKHENTIHNEERAKTTKLVSKLRHRRKLAHDSLLVFQAKRRQ